MSLRTRLQRLERYIPRIPTGAAENGAAEPGELSFPKCITASLAGELEEHGYLDGNRP
jgi:hypothetical protein